MQASDNESAVRVQRGARKITVQGSDTKMFLIRSAFWLGLALLVIQPQAFGLLGSAEELGAAAVETGRAAALDGLDQVACASIECTGAKLMAQSALRTQQPDLHVQEPAPYPAPAPAERRI